MEYELRQTSPLICIAREQWLPNHVNKAAMCYWLKPSTWNVAMDVRLSV